jgi:hypothetical protein
MKQLSSAVAALALATACAGIAYAGPNPPNMEAGTKLATYPIMALGGSGQHGTVTITPMGATLTKVTITLMGEPSSAVEPAHIHVGACPSPGAVKWPLSNVVHGSSVTTLELPFSTVNQSGFAVNIHQSAAAIGVYKACANITGS